MNNGRKWDWIALEAEWLTSSFNDFKTLEAFFSFKGISFNTAKRHTTGWPEKRESVLRRAAAKGIAKYENKLSDFTASRGNAAAIAADLVMSQLFTMKGKGKSRRPIRMKKALKQENAIRLLRDLKKQEFEILRLERMLAEAQEHNSPYKVSAAADFSEDTSGDESTANSRILQILKKDKARKHADALLKELGPIAPKDEEDAE